MGPPLAFITALILLCMEFTSGLIFLIGMSSHSSSNAVRNCPRVLGCSDVFLRACPGRPTNAQLGTNLNCTVASRVVQCCCLPESLGKLWLHEDGHYHAGKVIFCCCTNGTATGRRISSLHLTAVRFPGTTIYGDFTPCEIPLYTITDPLPDPSLSKTQASANRSPRRQYRRRRPSARKRVNRDSSVNKTRLHCLIGKRLGACAVTQAIRRARRARLSGKPTLGRRARRPNSRNRFLTVFG